MQLVGSTLTVAGDIVAFGNLSDVKLKRDIEEIPSEKALEIVSHLRPVSFKWSDDIHIKEKRGVKDCGFIAQEVSQVLPGIVGDVTEMTTKNVYKSIKHEKLTPYLTGAIQELNLELKTLKATIDTQQMLINSLVQKVSA